MTKGTDISLNFLLTLISNLAGNHFQHLSICKKVKAYCTRSCETLGCYIVDASCVTSVFCQWTPAYRTLFLCANMKWLPPETILRAAQGRKNTNARAWPEYCRLWCELYKNSSDASPTWCHLELLHPLPSVHINKRVPQLESMMVFCRLLSPASIFHTVLLCVFAMVAWVHTCTYHGMKRITISRETLHALATCLDTINARRAGSGKYHSTVPIAAAWPFYNLSFLLPPRWLDS